MDFAVDLALLVVAWAHVIISPYTKVEESFNLHATHDVFFYGVEPSALKNVCKPNCYLNCALTDVYLSIYIQYDHFIFPGAVPRSFIGSVLLAWLTRPVVSILSSIGFIRSKFDIQIIRK